MEVTNKMRINTKEMAGKVKTNIDTKGMIGRGTVRPFEDYDGDKVPNLLDCHMTNPRKQGFIHDVAKAGARKFLKGGTRYKAEKYIEKKERESEERKERREELKKVEREASFEEEKKLVREKAKIKREVTAKKYAESMKKGPWYVQAADFITRTPADTKKKKKRVVLTKPKVTTKKKRKKSILKKPKVTIKKKRARVVKESKDIHAPVFGKGWMG